MTSDAKQAIHSYVTDMLALEEHISQAFEGQIEALENQPDAVLALRAMHGTIEQHISTLRGLEDSRQAGPAQEVGEALKRVGSIVAGLGAAVIDILRPGKLAKNLRDDATACSLAATGYLMLHTTAIALNDAGTAAVAERHLEDHAGMIQRLHHLIPAAVLQVLTDDGLTVMEGAAPTSLEAYRKAWANA